MLKINNVDIYGWEAAIRGCRNALNSWSKSDSWFYDENFEGDIYGHTIAIDLDGFPTQQDCDLTELPEGMQSKYQQYPLCIIGPNDLDLMKRLAKAGSTDAKYRRMINVTADVIAPLYWWKEYDTYKVATVANSCSTMHKIQAKEFALDDFSHEHLCDTLTEYMNSIIGILNFYREVYNSFDEKSSDPNWHKSFVEDYGLQTKKDIWYQMIQLLPSSYNQRRTIQLNYEVLAAIYPKRKNHKLDEWHDFCDWIESLPCSELITLNTGDDVK